MVLAGVTIDKKDEKKLVKIGVKDSKQLSAERREELAKKIEEIASMIILRVQPCIIDSYRAKKINLDKIEAMKMAEIIQMCKGERIYVDALTVRPKKFKQLILSYLKDREVDLIAENFADQNYPVVSAASIVAKVNRDQVVSDIEKKVGQSLSHGYPHDKEAVEYVKKMIKERKKLPPYIRKSWVTTKLLQEKSWQKRIKDFIFRKKEECSDEE